MYVFGFKWSVYWQDVYVSSIVLTALRFWHGILVATSIFLLQYDHGILVATSIYLLQYDSRLNFFVFYILLIHSFPPVFVMQYLITHFSDFQLACIGSFLLHESVFFLSGLPFIYLERAGWLSKYKIQVSLFLNCIL